MCAFQCTAYSVSWHLISLSTNSWTFDHSVLEPLWIPQGFFWYCCGTLKSFLSECIQMYYLSKAQIHNSATGMILHKDSIGTYAEWHFVVLTLHNFQLLTIWTSHINNCKHKVEGFIKNIVSSEIDLLLV